jgi:hypothetical protein
MINFYYMVISIIRPVKIKVFNIMSANLVIEDYKIGGKTVHVVREDLLSGGSKVRGLIPYMKEVLKKNPNIKEFVYSSPAYGFAQVAISVAAAFLGVKAVIFVAARKEMHPNTKLAQQNGASIKEVPYGYLVVVKKHASDYVQADPRRYLLPWGLATEDFKDIMVKSLQKSAVAVAAAHFNSPSKIWVVVGSGTIFEVLARVFPKAQFNLVQVGADYQIPAHLAHRVDQFYTAPEKYEKVAKNPPPYPSNLWYDAKLWQFVASYAANDDYVWNVA